MGKAYNRLKFRDDLTLWFERIVLLAQKHGKPVTAVMNHQQMLPMVNASKSRMLVNIDAHSDLVDTTCTVFSCGTWVSYVDWAKEGTYHFRCSGHTRYGDCNGCNGGSDGIFGLFRVSNTSPWKKVKAFNNYKLPDLTELEKEASEISICLSPSYVDSYLEPVFRHVVKELKVPYTRGRRNEHFDVPRKIGEKS